MLGIVMRCQKCNSVRPGTVCHKCGTELIEPHPEWTEPELPPVDVIRKLAREVGYAIGEHGTKERDLDIIAVPWTTDAVDRQTLIDHICRNLPGTFIDDEQKPHGRVAVTISMKGWYRPIDLSICPRTN